MRSSLVTLRIVTATYSKGNTQTYGSKIYSKTGCSYCTKAKEWFQSTQLAMKKLFSMVHQERMDFYQRISDEVQVTSVPQIFIDEKHVGGYTDLIRQEDLILKKKFGGLEVSCFNYKPFRYP